MIHPDKTRLWHRRVWEVAPSRAALTPRTAGPAVAPCPRPAAPAAPHRPAAAAGPSGVRASPEGLRQRAKRLCLTRGGEDGAGEEEGGGEVPVPVSRGVAEHRDAVVAGLQHPHQELLQLLLREAGVLLQEALLQLAQLLAQQVFVGQLYR